MKIRLIAIVLLLTMLLGVIGCTGNNGENDTTTAPDDDTNVEDTAPKGETVLLAGGGSQTYQIVYPAKQPEAQAAAEKLAARIKATIGVELAVVFDGAATSEYEILVGDVARLESRDLVAESNFGAQDFAIAFINNKLCLAATNAQATAFAVDYYLSKVAVFDTTAKTLSINNQIKQVYRLGDEGAVTITSKDDYYVEFSISPGTPQETLARICYAGGGAWRIQTKNKVTDEFDDIGASQRLSLSLGELPVLNVEKITVSTKGNITTLSAPDGTKVELNTRAFNMEFFTAAGKSASTVTALSSNAGGSYIEGDLLADEAVFGTGERFNGANQRGKRISMFTTDIWSQASACYMAIPLLSTSRGAGMFINRYENMVIDLAKSKVDVWSAQLIGSVMDCYIYATDKIADVIKGYSDLSGYAEQPEEWTYGMIVCRYSPELSQKWSSMITPTEGRGEGVYDSIAMMEKYDLPWTGILAEPWSYPSSAKHKDLKELCDYVHSLGKKFLVYMGVGGASGGMAGYDDSYMLHINVNGNSTIRLPQTSSGVINPDAGNADDKRVYLDITNPEAVEWFFNDYWDYLSNEIGVDGCKIDFCEQIPENYDILFYDKNQKTLGTHHWYPSAYCAMFFEMLEQKADSGMNYSRGGGIGAQRAPYMWAGDQFRGWDSLGWQISAVLSSGLSGVPYMSYDMSGYQYGSMPTDIAYESRVFIRGTQFTAFTICMQTHGKVRKPYQFAEENAAYTYVTDLYRAYVKLHELLTPYITEYSAEASTTGMPVMRHLVLHWQDDKKVYDISDQYMFGDAFMVAPILTSADQRDIYLPEGEWKDLNTGKTYTVGKDGLELKDYKAGISVLPVFYNVNSTSKTATPELIEGIEEIFNYAKTVGYGK